MIDLEKFLNQIPADLQALVALSCPLRELTTLEVGGPAALVCRVRNPEQALRFQGICGDFQTPSFIIGAGSNILADDAGYPGVILHIAIGGFELQGDTVTVGAGLGFDQVIARTLDAGLTGLEFASGIPGTLGGALAGNAGCYGHEIGDFLVEALVLHQNGTLEKIGPEDFGLGYRRTKLRENGSLILEATLRLKRGNVDLAVQARTEKIADRQAKHPVNTPSAGSWFHNLPADTPGGRRRPAGYFLELVGAKEMSEGDARVFAGHANMIINAGQATSSQVSTLAHRMRQAVKDKFGLDLEEEVRRLGP